MNELRISPDLSLPLESVTQTFAILAKRGMGKTYTAAVVAEEMLKAGAHVVVVDPVGVWWGLRSAADGQGPGLPIAILGGDRGDVPLPLDGGERVADLVVDERLSVVLDVSHFRKGERTRFLTDFCETLFRRNRQALHLILDEADTAAPQRPMPGEQRLLGAVEDLVRRGRARGLGVTLITQRPAVLSKDVLTQAEVLVTLRLIAPQDRSAIDDWIRVHGTPAQREELMASLPSLPVGQAWFWSPGWLDLFQRVRVRPRETFDSSATPKTGAAVVEPRELAPVDLAALRERLAPPEAREEAAISADAAELRARIADLEKELRERREAPILTGAVLARAECVLRDMESLAGRLATEIEQLSVLVEFGTPAQDPEPHSEEEPIASAAGQDRFPERAAVEVVPTPRPAVTAAVAAEPLKPGAQRMLWALARHHPMRITRAQLGSLAELTPSGGAWQSYWAHLTRAGFVTQEGKLIAITPAGLAQLGQSAPPPARTAADRQQLWRQALPAGPRKLFDALLRAPKGLAKDALAVQVSMSASGGAFSGYLADLRRNGLVEERGRLIYPARMLLRDDG